MVEQAMFWGGVSCLAYVSYFVKDAFGRNDPYTKDDMLKGTYFCGLPGCGKTTFMVNRAVEYAKHGWGVIWIEIHDGAKRLLNVMPPGTEVVYVCPWADKVVGLNALERHSFDDNEKFKIADRVTLLFKRAFDRSWGDTIEGLIYNGTIAVMEACPKEQVTLTDILKFFENPNFRIGVLKGIKNDIVKSFFEGIKWESESVNSSIRKFARILTNDNARAVLGQKEGLSLLGAMHHGKVVIFDFDQSELGPSTANFLASIVLSQIEHTALIRPVRSKPCAVFADEFQEYATDSLPKMIEQARKKEIGVHLSHQSNVAQLSGSLAKAVHECATHFYGRLTLDDATRAAKHCGAHKPWFKEEVKFTHEDFIDLPNYIAIVKRLFKGTMRPARWTKLPYESLPTHNSETFLLNSNEANAIDRDEALAYTRIIPDAMRGEKKK